MPISPAANDVAIAGSDSSAAPAATHRSAFHRETPSCIDTQCGMSCAPSSSQASCCSSSARQESISRCADDTTRLSS
jgi:hypothetical protein